MEVRLALDKAKETYNPDASVPAAAEGRRDGTKKARAARDTVPAAQWLQASIEQCIVNVKSNAARREEKSDVWWLALMINVAAKKRNIDLEVMMRAHTSRMDEKVKAWCPDDTLLKHKLMRREPSTLAQLMDVVDQYAVVESSMKLPVLVDTTGKPTAPKPAAPATGRS
ncbi:methionyl-trna synthetase [Hordeum vulgare]|nr:methionyl-trna synthetase [Hordeum vulgare]